MASVNKVILVGNLGKDPETRYAPSGDAICNITLATTDTWRDKASGEKREATEWHRVVFFGKLGEIAGEYLRKGSQVYVEGEIRYDKYTGQDGVEKYTTDIVANEMQMLGGRAGGSGEGGGYAERGERPQRSAPPRRESAPAQRAPAPAASQAGGGFDDFADDDIPF